MRRADLVLGLVFVALATFVIVQVTGRRPAPEPRATTVASAPETVGGSTATVVQGDAAPPERDVRAIRARLTANAHGTFIGEVLAARDSSIARWADRRTTPVRVWIDERSPLAAGDPQLANNVRRAFDDWGRAGIPLRFTYVNDSARAEVTVGFVEAFTSALSGRTQWTRDTNWWIVGGDIRLALRTSAGYVLTGPQLYAVALHEVGHLLGLDHTADTLAIMTPRVRVADLSLADVATMRLIYTVPPGPVR